MKYSIDEMSARSFADQVRAMRDIAVWHDNSCWVAEIIAPDCEDDGIRVEGETEEDTLGAARALAKGPFQILRCGAPS